MKSKDLNHEIIDKRLITRSDISLLFSCSRQTANEMFNATQKKLIDQGYFVIDNRIPYQALFDLYCITIDDLKKTSDKLINKDFVNKADIRNIFSCSKKTAQEMFDKTKKAVEDAGYKAYRNTVPTDYLFKLYNIPMIKRKESD